MMTAEPKKGGSRILDKLFDNSMFLVLGAVAALFWANLDHANHSDSYQRLVHFDVASIWSDSPEHASLPAVTEHSAHHGATNHDDVANHEANHGTLVDTSSPQDHAAHALTIHFLVNDILMALFFAIAAKEVWEAFLPGGSLANFKKAATPLFATVGGIVGPAAIYLGLAAYFGKLDVYGQGWAVPCATDIAFSYLVARIIFGNGHPAISFLLLLAIADDAAGLAILAIFYPSAELSPVWMIAAAAAFALGMGMKKSGVRSFWWYLAIPGVISWYAFYKAGIHPALGLVPIIPTMPHAVKDLGLFANEESQQCDALNQFEHWWKRPVELILGLFALVNAGVVLSSVGLGTHLVLAGLIVGKPLGIVLCTLAATKLFRLELPDGMNMRHTIVVGFIASLGFTVALFVSTAAFPIAGAVQDSVKMGALGSFLTPILAITVGLMLGIRPAALGQRRRKTIPTTIKSYT